MGWQKIIVYNPNNYKLKPKPKIDWQNIILCCKKKILHKPKRKPSLRLMCEPIQVSMLV
jgi:hypothetical protein